MTRFTFDGTTCISNTKAETFTFHHNHYKPFFFPDFISRLHQYKLSRSQSVPFLRKGFPPLNAIKRSAGTMTEAAFSASYKAMLFKISDTTA